MQKFNRFCNICAATRFEMFNTQTNFKLYFILHKNLMEVKFFPLIYCLHIIFTQHKFDFLIWIWKKHLAFKSNGLYWMEYWIRLYVIFFFFNVTDFFFIFNLKNVTLHNFLSNFWRFFHNILTLEMKKKNEYKYQRFKMEIWSFNKFLHFANWKVCVMTIILSPNWPQFVEHLTVFAMFGLT